MTRSELLIPVKKYVRLPGDYVLPARMLLGSARDTDRLALEQLAVRLKARTGVSTRLVWQAEGSAAVRLMRDPGLRQPEGYRLEVSPDGIVVAGSTDAGVFYGVQTLCDLIDLHGHKLPCCRIDDWPDFARRGIYYDCARGKVPTVETLCDLVTRLARWKINEFQIYIKNTFTWQRHPEIARGFSPYTPDDLLAVQAHCRRHHVRFVPSMATLSHAELILQLPRYRHLAEFPGFRGWEGGTLLCPTDPGSLRLIRDLYAEFVPLFEATDMNICCDEPWELGQGRSKRAVSARGTGRVYLEFLLKMHRLCAQHGKRMNVWGDIVLKYPELIPELPNDLVLLNWDYAAKGTRIPRTREFADAGVPVMVCPGTSSWQRHGTDLPNAMGNVAEFAATGRRFGAVGLLNTDWGDFGHRNLMAASLHGFAHGAAHAWHGRGVCEDVFTERFARHLFGAGQELAAALRSLGAAGDQSTRLYHALIEPIRAPVTRFISTFRRVPIVTHYPAHYPAVIDAAAPEEVRAHFDRLDPDAFGRFDSRSLPSFERIALREYTLASEMDRLAARRILLGRRVHSGEALAPSEARRWAEDMRHLMQRFETVWMARNRRSRLEDNLKLMRLSESECRRLES